VEVVVVVPVHVHVLVVPVHVLVEAAKHLTNLEEIWIEKNEIQSLAQTISKIHT
jgi:hypothetical protein